EKIASFHSQCRDLTEVQLELTELIRLLSDSRVTSEKQKALEYDLKSKIAPYEQKIEDLKEIVTSGTKELERCSGALAECEKNLERAITEKRTLLDKEFQVAIDEQICGVGGLAGPTEGCKLRMQKNPN
ncbi:hypothetical protein KIN20_017284, partial [Parelaphostrongylus tenuis]